MEPGDDPMTTVEFEDCSSSNACGAHHNVLATVQAAPGEG